MTIRLGDILVEHGAISEQQRAEILEFQKLHHRPFGLLAEQMFGVSPSTVENAWAEQYASLAPKLIASQLKPDDGVLDIVEARQAWQFGVLPLREEEGELVLATTVDRLARAMRFAGWRVSQPCRFAVCDEDALELALTMAYGDAGYSLPFQREVRFA